MKQKWWKSRESNVTQIPSFLSYQKSKQKSKLIVIWTSNHIIHIENHFYFEFDSGIILEILISMMEQRSIGIWSSNLVKSNVVSTTLQSDKEQIEEGTVKTRGILRLYQISFNKNDCKVVLLSITFNRMLSQGIWHR